jgi:hypothetical protein
MDDVPWPAGKVCPKRIACKATGLPGGAAPIDGVGPVTVVSSPSEAMTRLGSPPQFGAS